MGSFIRRLFWFILVLASGFVALLLGGAQYGINFDLNSWAKTAGVHEVSGVAEFINQIPALLNYPIIKSYGFYGSLALLLIFLILFATSKRSSRSNKTEAADTLDTQDIKAELETDSEPDNFADTFDGSSTVTELIAETNSDAVVGTDGNIYDGTATFTGTDTYSHIDSRSQVFTGDDADVGHEDDEVEDDILAQAPDSKADGIETGHSHLSDTELKSKTLDFVDEIRSFEADYHSNRDETVTELTDFSNEENLTGALQSVKDTYEQRQEEFSSEFKSKYRPEAVAFRQEISKRLGVSEPSDNFNPALDSGMLVGTNPVTDAADLIEDMVKKLA